MSDAELKLQLVRLIDQHHGQTLRTIYDFLQSKLSNASSDNLTSLEKGYQAMAADTEREAAAFEWSEGTLNVEEL